MTRPDYETDSDLCNEKNIAANIESAWGVSLQKTPRRYPYDYIALDFNEVAVALIEIKHRNNDSKKYQSYMISMGKLAECQGTAKTVGLAFVLVVGFSDKIMFWPYKKNQFDIEIGGRRDRGDNQDIEPVAQIPMKHFKDILA